MCPPSGESVFNKASRQSAIPTCELHRRELRDGGNRGTPEEEEEGGGGGGDGDAVQSRRAGGADRQIDRQTVG